MLKNSNISRRDETSEDKMDKALDIANVVLGLIILTVLVYLLIIILTGSSSSSSVTVSDPVYKCKTAEEQVLASNKSTLDYFDSAIDDNYDSILISPIGIQGSLYNYYESQDKQIAELFKIFNNGLNSWDESSKIFNQSCFNTVTTDGVDSEDALLGKLYDVSDGYINLLGVDIDTGENIIYSVFNLEYGIKGAVYDEKNDTIEYEGDIAYKKGTDYEAVKLDLSNDNYSIYLVDGNIKNLTFDSFEKQNAHVTIVPYIYQSSGSINNLASKLSNDDLGLYMFAQFGYDSHNHEVVKSFKSTINTSYLFATEYYFAVVDNSTNLIVAVGKNFS